MNSLLAAAAASAFSFCAIVLHSSLRVITISASLLREIVATCAKRKLAAIHVAIAMLPIATANAGGYPLLADGWAFDQNLQISPSQHCFSKGEKQSNRRCLKICRISSL